MPRKKKSIEEGREEKQMMKILSDGEKIIEFANSEGWKLAKRKLLSKIAILDSISAMPTFQDMSQKIREYEVRQGVVSIIWDWINDIEGSAKQAKQVTEAMREIREESFIKVYGDDE